MIFSGPKFRAPRIDYLSWLLARRSYHDDSEIFIDAHDPNNAITYGELVDLTKRIGQGLREIGIGANGLGKDVVMVFSPNQVIPSISFFAYSRLCILFALLRVSAPAAFILLPVQI